jgi:transcriptional regulator with XRE-family HTH domain
MAFRYDDIGNRLKAFRLGSELSAEQIARRIGISRTAYYRIEKGELVKIETLEKLSELLNVSMPTLLGVGMEYIGSAVSYFERLRQLEETAEHIVVLAGPISILLASDAFAAKLEDVLSESIPSDAPDRARILVEVKRIVALLEERRAVYRKRQPTIVNLISSLEIERFLESGYIGRSGLPEKTRRDRQALAHEEVAHFASAIESEPLGVQVGLVTDIVPHAGFQIFRQSDRQVLSISPFRLGEHPNVRVGMAMITTAPEALALHHRTVQELWRRAHKGLAAAHYLRGLLANRDGTARHRPGHATPS